MLLSPREEPINDDGDELSDAELEAKEEAVSILSSVQNGIDGNRSLA
jgi:hypothetical protein